MKKLNFKIIKEVDIDTLSINKKTSIYNALILMLKRVG